MQTITVQLEAVFRKAISKAFGVQADPLIAQAVNEKFGDYQSNAAMGLAKQLATKTGQKTNPRSVAEKITENLELGDIASEISIAGPGFINVRLSGDWLRKQLASIGGDPRLGIETTANPRQVVVDYSGPNVAKEMHVGHIRSTLIGDALARTIEFQGNPVIRQNHLGDWGTQFGMLIAYLDSPDRKTPVDYEVHIYDTLGVNKSENTGTSPQTQVHISDLEEFYRAAKVEFDKVPPFADRAREIVVALQAGDADIVAKWNMIVEASRQHFQPLYLRMGINLSRADERGESFYNPFLAEVVNELKQNRVAVESQGAVVVWVEGFESPLIIQKSGGGFGYPTTDLAAIRFRVQQLGARRIIYVTDARQIQHFKQVFFTARKANWVKDVDLEHVTFGSILGEDGTPFKTRTGGTVKLKDLLDEAHQRAFTLVTEKNPELPESQRQDIARAVGIGGIKYFDLARDRTGDYVFSWEKMLAMDGNTAPYLQYAYARIRSIFRKAGLPRGNHEQIQLQTSHELTLAKHILRLGEVIEVVGRELKPHHLCNYLYELATNFSGFYENCPVLQSPEPTRSSRLGLCEVTARTMAVGLDLLGIEHPEQM
ncbi:MAG: arginine--tRNA ligase [Planctomycetota bacterium]|nr:arginine--tRNA ligase [Planctomycetota bacterium]